MNKRVLVTGGAGYVGSQTCKALRQAGYTPVVFDNLSSGHEYAVKWGPFVLGDLIDLSQIERAIAQYKPVAVLHFAADVWVVESMKDPSKYYRNNVVATLNLLDAMRRHKVENIIFSSTCATYGNPQFVPITEDHPQNPISPYGRTKWIAEQMMTDFATAYGLKPIFLRYFNVAGADLDMELGENREYEARIVTILIEGALGIRPEITIHGSDFNTRDGTAVRDYLHVVDLAQAHVKALNRLLETKCGDAFNLGTGTGTTILELIRAVEKYSGKKISYQIAQRRPGEPEALVADYKKAERILGWRPTRSSTEHIVETAWKWQAKLENLKSMQKLDTLRCSTLPTH